MEVFEHNASLYQGNYFLEIPSEHLPLLGESFWEITDHAEDFGPKGDGISSWKFLGISPALKAVLLFQELNKKEPKIEFVLKGENNMVFFQTVIENSNSFKNLAPR